MDDSIILGIPLTKRTEIRELNQRVANVFAMQGTDERTALIVLLNVLGSLIGTQMYDEHKEWIARVQMILPFYVESYHAHEKKL